MLFYSGRAQQMLEITEEGLNPLYRKADPTSVLQLQLRLERGEASDGPLHSESIYIDMPGGYQLHMKRFVLELFRKLPLQDSSCPCAFLLHGAIENGRIFYSNESDTENLKGLGPYMARRGYDVYVADLRGKGSELS